MDTTLKDPSPSYSTVKQLVSEFKEGQNAPLYFTRIED